MKKKKAISWKEKKSLNQFYRKLVYNRLGGYHSSYQNYKNLYGGIFILLKKTKY
jgi:hypothetical protein